ncbi:MAG TPA: alkaline phosphatase D family protein [Luteibaculaceae bacterium]|nr:alkaline phosphatase D family protein [Luteibaculaceae bacterium]
MKQLYTLMCCFLVAAGFAQTQFADRLAVDPNLFPFFHGVASGDPLSDRVIIWTRVSPQTTEETVEVTWRVALNTGMTEIVKSGTFTTSQERDFTVKIDVTGLDPNTYYYYDFRALGAFSKRGRTKTAPQSGEATEVRMGVVSCSNYEYGYFNAYKKMAQRNDLDMVLHLGDYIYEYAVGGYSANIEGRTHEPEGEIITLQDYRIRHSHYKLDPDLQAVHQQYPFVCVWDDHESTNNSWRDGAENHTEGAEGTWTERKLFSIKSYMEWMPIRESNGLSIYREITYGNLLNLYMLDTRLEGRDEQAALGSLMEINDENRRLIGDAQFNWLTQAMDASTARWNVVGQQVMMAPLRAGLVPINTDQWDGYEFERQRLYDFITANEIANFVVLTGDIHTSWANDLPNGLLYEPILGTGSVGVEFVCTSVTSPGLDIPLGAEVIKAGNPHVQYLDLTQKGYLVLHLTDEFIQGDWYYVNVNEPSNNETFGAAYRAVSGSNHLRSASTPTTTSSPRPSPAPALPIGYTTDMDENTRLTVFGIYPNPFQEEIYVQFHTTASGPADLRVLDQQGKVLIAEHYPALAPGVNYLKINTRDLPEGLYTIAMQQGGRLVARNVVRK